MQRNPLNQEEKAEHPEDNPALSNVVEQNIRTIIQLRLKAARAHSVQDRLAEGLLRKNHPEVWGFVRRACAENQDAHVLQ